MRENYAVYVAYAVGFLDLFGVSMTVPLLTKHAKDLGASSTVAGLIGSLYGFLQLFSCPAVGRWSDVSGRKFSLICCLLMTTAGYALLAFGNSLLILAIARIPAGLFKHSQELSRAYLSDITPRSQHPRVYGRFNSVSNIGFILGPIIGGHIVDGLGGFSAAALATTASFLVNLLLVVLLLPVGQQQVNEKQRFVREEQHDCREQGASKKDNIDSQVDCNSKAAQCKSAWNLLSVWDIMLARFLLGAAVLVYRHDFVSTVIRRFNSSNTAAGYVSSFASFIGTATGFVVGIISDRYKNDSLRLFFHSSVMQSISLLLLAVSPNVVLLAVCQASLSASCAIGRVAAVEMTVSRGGKQHAGTLMGAGATVLSLARMLSPFISGLSQELSEDFGPVLLSVSLAIAGTSLLFPMLNACRIETKAHSD